MNLFYGLQAEHDELEAKFKKERAALEAKCQKLYEEVCRSFFRRNEIAWNIQKCSEVHVGP